VTDGLQWVVIGAGPAGIAAIGQLIDANISLNKITWIDPSFTVGDFGTAWGHVHSNTPIESFLSFRALVQPTCCLITFIASYRAWQNNCNMHATASYVYNLHEPSEPRPLGSGKVR